MLRFAVGAFMTFALATPVHAEDWWFVTGGMGGKFSTMGFIDKQSITRDAKGRLTAWFVWVTSRADGDGITHDRELSRFDCESKTSAILRSISYDESDFPKKDKSYKPHDSAVVPGTLASDVLDYVCGHPSGNEFQVDDPVRVGRETHAAMAADGVLPGNQ